VVVERGYYIVDYKRKTRHLPEDGAFDHAMAYRMAGFVYKRRFEGRLPWYIDPEDLVQEAVIRIYEMSGHPASQEKKYRFYLALNAMRGFVERQQRLRGGQEDPGFEEFSWKHGSSDTWGRSHRATEKMCRIIEARGITPRELEA
jgi:DNA-directed RNA polymerase specialized sigma24 family protein